MPKMELTSTNQEFAAAAADMIDIRGKAQGQYEDKYTGACCPLGAFRILVFGRIHSRLSDLGMPEMNRYFELIDWVAEQVKVLGEEADSNAETIIGRWSDARLKSVVVKNLRELGRSSDVLEPQA